MSRYRIEFLKTAQKEFRKLPKEVQRLGGASRTVPSPFAALPAVLKVGEATANQGNQRH